MIVAGLSALLLLAVPSSFANGAPASKSSTGTIVIVFKDGHRQTFNLSEIERVEFPGGASASTEPLPYNPSWPPRGRFFGKWEADDGNGGTFTITLKEDGEAFRSIGDVRGKWVYVNGEAHVTWDDGAQDAIRKVGNKFRKYAYAAGKSFTDKPDNEGDAHNTTPKPI
jgi:hypothetical protein